MRKLCIALGIALLLTAPSAVLAAGGAPIGPMGGGESRSAPRTDEKAARAAYEKGLQQREQALAHEKAAKAASGDAGQKELAQAKAGWEAAVKLFSKAVKAKDDFYQAHNELGHAYRKLGRYTEALAAYDEALGIEPDYAPAMEYLGEAYLGLNRFSDVKSTYMRLFQLDRSLAAQLMTALTEWSDAAKATPPQGASPESVQEFLGWIQERKNLAAQTGEVSTAKAW